MRRNERIPGGRSPCYPGGVMDPERIRLLGGALLAIVLVLLMTMPRRRSRTPSSDAPRRR